MGAGHKLKKITYNHKIILFLYFIPFFIPLLITGCLKNEDQEQKIKKEGVNKVFADIAKSHIDANIPEEEAFDEILKRDLKKYFSKSFGEDIEVVYDLLRKGPTQTGIAFPKYYSWVIVTKNNEVIDKGAVRLAAIDKEKFDVTDYLNADEIKKNPQSIYLVFPKPVCEKIEKKLEL